MDPCHLADDEIFQLCKGADDRHLRSKDGSGRKVVKVTSELVVKFGLGVTLQEAHSQRFVSQKVNREVVRVPQVHRFFTRQDLEFGAIGYLVMENIEGKNLEQMDWRKLSLESRIVAALNEIHSIRSTLPGPVHGGHVHGCLWSEEGSGTTFNDVQQLEFYLNERLACFGESIRLQEEDLRFCHLDVTPRNFMLDLQGRLCLLDWATAGFFPRYFELWYLDFAQHVIGESFGQDLLQHLKMTSTEALEIPKLTLVYRYNTHCATLDKHPVTIICH